MSFETTFANPNGRISRGRFIGALIVLLAATAFYFFLVKGLNGQWVLLMLLYPGFVLHARRLRDMGQTSWLALPPAALIGAAIWPHAASRGSFEAPLTMIALAVYACFALWCCIGKGKVDANRFGDPAAA